MSQKLKVKINSIFVQLNRYERQTEDFSAESFVKDIDSYFTELDRADLSHDHSREIDEQLKLRLNTVPRNAGSLIMVVSNLMALYFWYVRRPPADCSNALVAAKKLRGTTDDSQFIEQTLSPLVFGEKIQGLGKEDYRLKQIMLERGSKVSANFKETDPVQASATRIVRTDFWHKKMLHVASFHLAGRHSEIPTLTPRDELAHIASQSPFAAWYLRTTGIFIGQNRLLIFLKNTLASFFSLISSVVNYRYVFHILRDRWAVYIVYLIVVLVFLYAALNVKSFWYSFHHKQVTKLTTTESGGGK
jgi:hypothetical protein